MHAFRRTALSAPLVAFTGLLLACAGDAPERPRDTMADEAGVREDVPEASAPAARQDASPQKAPPRADGGPRGRPDGAQPPAPAEPTDAAEPSSPTDAAVEEDAASEHDAAREVSSSDAGMSVDSSTPSPTDAGARDAEVFPPRGEPGRCKLPSSCRTVTTLIFDLRACCLGTDVCGYDLVRPPELREAFFGPLADGSPIAEGTCVPVSRVFRAAPGESEERVDTENGPDILVTPECDARLLAGFSLPGCCMPDNKCGVSTHHTADVLAGLVVSLTPQPFTRIQCMPVDDLNMQFKQTNLAGFGQLPPSTQTCDYNALDATLPPNP